MAKITQLTYWNKIIHIFALGLAPTLPPKVTTKPGDGNVKLFPSKGTSMAGNTVIDFKLVRSASPSMPVVYTAMPNGFDIRPTVSDFQ